MVAALAAFVFAAGCGSSATSTTPASGGGSPSTAQKVTLTVLGAASLSKAFPALATAYEAAHPGVQLHFSFAGSQVLAAQVRQGAPADVIATADTKTMTGLGSLVTGSTVFAHNLLTIAVASGNPKHISGLADLGRSGLKVVLAAATVPAGKYAKQALAAAHVTVHPVSLELDVTSVLARVELGVADAGIVYVTDVRSAKGKVAAVTIPAAQNVVASYPAAVIAASHNAAAAAAFVQWLASPTAAAILTTFGFKASTG